MVVINWNKIIGASCFVQRYSSKSFVCYTHTPKHVHQSVNTYTRWKLRQYFNIAVCVCCCYHVYGYVFMCCHRVSVIQVGPISCSWHSNLLGATTPNLSLSLCCTVFISFSYIPLISHSTSGQSCTNYSILVRSLSSQT